MVDITWEDFNNGVFSRFGPNQFKDHFAELIKIRKNGTMVEYQGQFEK